MNTITKLITHTHDSNKHATYNSYHGTRKKDNSHNLGLYANYNSFSGCDVVVSAQMALPSNADAETIMKNHVLGSLQTISYSTHQDRAPVRSIGNINAIDYVQGQRTIAGTMVFAMFHEHWMTPLLAELEEITESADIWSDELPALNLTISMANEYGYKSNMVIYGVKFIEDGGVMSINDLYTENTLQYVATGIQPLKSNGQYSHSCEIDKTNKLHITFKNEKKDYDFTPPNFKWKQKSLFELDVPVYEYLEHDGHEYFPTITPDPFWHNSKKYNHHNYKIEFDQNESVTNLFMTNIDNGNNFYGYKPIENIWVVSVPEGIYSLSFNDKYGNKITYSELIMAENKQKSKSGTNYPVIAEIGSTSVKVLPNDLNHDQISLSEVSYVDYETATGVIPTEEIKQAVLYKIENNTSVGRSNSKEVTIEYLKPDTEYIIQTVNSTDVQDCSATIRFKTFSSQEEKYNILKNYISVNKNLLINRDEVLSFDYDTLKYENSNIIDAVLQCDSFDNEDIKTEILFYATKLQNEFNHLYNDYGISTTVSKNKLLPLVNMFTIDESVQSLVVYKRTNNKNYFVTRSNALNNYQYTGKHSIRYYIQSILSNNDKGNYVDFICYDDEQKKLLHPYTDTYNLFNASFIEHNTLVDKYDNDFLLAIKAAKNLNLYRNIFDIPYATYADKTLHVDTNYAADKNNTYYLCIALPEDALEYTPIRKIVFEPDDKELSIASYYTGILKNKYYLLWIQDKNYNNISKPFILSTYAEDYQVTDYYNNKCMKYVKEMKNSFSIDSIYKSYIDLLYSEIAAVEELKFKDIDLFIIQMFLNTFEHNTNENILNMLNKILDFIYAQHNHFAAKASLRRNTISFSSDISHYIVATHITADDIKKEMCAEYDINQEDEGFTLLYASNSHSNITSGYILINNVTKKIYTSNIIVGGITNG